jgi:hypothetical protein
MGDLQFAGNRPTITVARFLGTFGKLWLYLGKTCQMPLSYIKGYTLLYRDGILFLISILDLKHI